MKILYCIFLQSCTVCMVAIKCKLNPADNVSVEKDVIIKGGFKQATWNELPSCLTVDTGP